MRENNRILENELVFSVHIWLLSKLTYIWTTSSLIRIVMKNSKNGHDTQGNDTVQENQMASKMCSINIHLGSISEMLE